MVLTGSMAPLAVDSFRQVSWKDCRSLQAIGFDRRIAVVAKHASIRDGSTKTGVVWPVVTGAHGPVAAIFTVPGDRKLHQLFRLCSADIAAGMISGTEPVVDGCC